MYIYTRKTPHGKRQREEIKRRERKSQVFVGDKEKRRIVKEWMEESSRFPHNSNFHPCPHCAGWPSRAKTQRSASKSHSLHRLRLQI